MKKRKCALLTLRALLAVALRGAVVARAGRAGAAQHLGTVPGRLGVTEGTHAAVLEAAGVLGGADALAEGLSLRPGREDRHVHVPGGAAPLRPDAVVFVLAAGVGMHKKGEVGAVVHEPGHHSAVVVHGHEHT